MKKLIRTVWENTTEIHELLIDEKLVDAINQNILYNMIPEQRNSYIPLTIKDIEKIYMGETFDRITEKYSVKDDDNEICECTLVNSVIDYIDEVLWECDSYTVDSDIEDWETKIVDV